MADDRLVREVDRLLGGYTYFPRDALFGQDQTREFLLRMGELMPRQGRCLDLGCGPQASWRPVVEAYGLTWHGADVVVPEGPPEGFRQVLDHHRLDFPDGWFDVVCSIDALEHFTHPEATIAEVSRVLAPGGWFWGTCAFWQREHESYFHLTHRGLRALLERHGFTVQEIQPSTASGFLVTAQRLFGGNGLVEWSSPRRFAWTLLRCSVNVPAFAICALLERARRRFGRYDPLSDCGSLYFIARRQ